MQWRPDTCRCKLEYNGANVPANFVRVVQKCSSHLGVADAALAQVLLDENQSKNLIHSELLKDATLTKVTFSNGQPVTELDDGIEYVWNFVGLDEGRTLQVEVRGARTLAPAAKAALRVVAATLPLKSIEVL